MDPGCLSCIGMLFGSLRTGDIRKFCQVTGRESTPRTTAVFNIARGRFSNTEAALATSEGSNLRKRFVFNAITPASAVGTTIIVDLVLRDDNWLASNLVWMPAKGHPMVLMGEVPQAELMALVRDARGKKHKHSRALASKRPLTIGALVAAICLSFYFGVNYIGQRVPSSDAEARASAETTKSASKGKSEPEASSAKKADADSVTKQALAAKRKADDTALKDDNALSTPKSEDKPEKISKPAARRGVEANSADGLTKNRKARNTRPSVPAQQVKSSRKSAAGVKAQEASTEQAGGDIKKAQGQSDTAEQTDKQVKSAERAPSEPVAQTGSGKQTPKRRLVQTSPSTAPISTVVMSTAAEQRKKLSVAGKPAAEEASHVASKGVSPGVKNMVNPSAAPVNSYSDGKSKTIGQAAGVTQGAKPVVKPSIKAEAETSQAVSQPAPPPPMPLAPKMPKGPDQTESAIRESTGMQPPVPMVNAGESGQ